MNKLDNYPDKSRAAQKIFGVRAFSRQKWKILNLDNFNPDGNFHKIGHNLDLIRTNLGVGRPDTASVSVSGCFC